jgi:hypothetical protein
MENLYLHNAFKFVGNTSHAGESSSTINHNPFLATYSPALRHQDTSSQEICLEMLSCFYSNDEYMGSTSPYDDDGC